MSFGKSFSPNKSVVDDAVKYAASKDVLLIHAAGNDNQNNDKKNNFPNDKISSGEVDNWVDVGATYFLNNEKLTAPFSNYGKKSVDVFAPGQSIKSTTPNSSYSIFSGTSMAAPVTSGVAAIIRSYYPELTAPEVKEILIKSSVRIKHKVNVPGEKGKKTKFKKLARSKGVISAYNAVKMAEERKK
jgi:subtilisin family serine protease